LLHRAPLCGVTTVLAVCFESNTRSCRAFAKLGFERWGLLPGCVVMVRIGSCSRFPKHRSLLLAVSLMSAVFRIRSLKVL
jgi:hypothetical protein